MTPLLLTDLDGTLLDASSLSFEPARGALARLAARGVLVVPCTSKSVAEGAAWARRLGLAGPWVAENGGAIVEADGKLLPLGPPPSVLERAMEAIARMTSGAAASIASLPDGEVAHAMGATLDDARLAKDRRFDVAFRFAGAAETWRDGIEAIAGRWGLRVTRGNRWWHLHGASDKGTAAAVLAERVGGTLAAGVGDSENDASMLRACARRYAVAKPDGSHDAALVRDVPGLVALPKPGPEGWALAADDFLATLA